MTIPRRNPAQSDAVEHARSEDEMGRRQGHDCLGDNRIHAINTLLVVFSQKAGCWEDPPEMKAELRRVFEDDIRYVPSLVPGRGREVSDYQRVCIAYVIRKAEREEGRRFAHDHPKSGDT